MLFGACYYPEHWPRDRWEIDAQLMKAAGFNIVRLAEFAWAKMEPEEGRYDFTWLDEAIDVLASRGLQVILGTPTAGPPAWLMEKHPDMYQRDAQGHVRGFGTRRHYCFNNARFHHYTRAIVERMARHYAQHESVIAWQIDNELGGIQTTRCYCENCAVAFREWLQERYGSLDAVNEAWGTIFSSQTFSRWEHVHVPGYSVHQSHNPGLVLDFWRFSSDAVKRYERMQVELLRDACPGQLMTTNFMGSYNEVDYDQLAENLDIVSLDTYPNLKRVPEERAFRTAANLDMTRGYKRRTFWVMEHQSGAPGGGMIGPNPKPGELRRWTYQSIARGADGIVYFRWRTAPFALEQFWHGILPHHGSPGRHYREVQQVGAEWAKLAPLLENTQVQCKVAIVRSFDNEWAFEIQPHARGYDYKEHLTAYYRYFHERNIQVDIISSEAPYDDYDLLLLPNLMMSKPHVVERIYDYVREGGHVVMDFRAGAKHWNNRMREQPLPGPFSDLLGITIEDYGVIDAAQPIEIAFCEEEEQPVPHSFRAAVWYDVVSLGTAKEMAIFTKDYFAGSPAVTKHDYGNGKAYYIATEPEQAALAHTLDRICQTAGIGPVLPNLPETVEVVRRTRGAQSLIFLIHHGHHPVTWTPDRAYRDVLTDNVVRDTVELQPNDVLVLA